MPAVTYQSAQKSRDVVQTFFLAGTFPNLPDIGIPKAIRNLKVVASDNNFYNGERSEPSSIILSISAAEKCYAALRGLKAHSRFTLLPRPEASFYPNHARVTHSQLPPKSRHVSRV